MVGSRNRLNWLIEPRRRPQLDLAPSPRRANDCSIPICTSHAEAKVSRQRRRLLGNLLSRYLCQDLSARISVVEPVSPAIRSETVRRCLSVCRTQLHHTTSPGISLANY